MFYRSQNCVLSVLPFLLQKLADNNGTWGYVDGLQLESCRKVGFVLTACFRQDQLSRIFWHRPSISVDSLDRAKHPLILH